MPTTTCARCGRPVEPGDHLCSQCREEVGPAAAAGAPAATVTRQAARSSQEQQQLERRRGRWPSTMVRPSPVQYHATIFVTIFIVLAGLGVWAFLAHRGVGPFHAAIHSRSEFRAGSQAIVVAVENQGSRSSRATCTFRALDATEGEMATATLLTEPIPAHETIDVTQVFHALRAEPAAYDLVCT